MPGMEEFEAALSSFSDREAAAVCLGLARFGGLQAKLKTSAQTEAVHAQAFGWLAGNCYDAMSEANAGLRAKAAKSAQAKTGEPDADVLQMVDGDEAVRLAQTGRQHRLHEAWQQLVAHLAKAQQKIAQDPSLLKKQMEDLQSLNEKMSAQLQSRVQSLESTKNLQLVLAVLAIALTLLGACACYSCFFAGGKREKVLPLFEDVYKDRLAAYKKKAAQLVALEKNIQQEKDRLAKQDTSQSEKLKPAEHKDSDDKHDNKKEDILDKKNK